jgi:hypothetical protein
MGREGPRVFHLRSGRDERLAAGCLRTCAGRAAGQALDPRRIPGCAYVRDFAELLASISLR